MIIYYYSARAVCSDVTSHCVNIVEVVKSMVKKQDLRFIVPIREDLIEKPFADVITKAALSPRLFKTPRVALAGT